MFRGEQPESKFLIEILWRINLQDIWLISDLRINSLTLVREYVKPKTDALVGMTVMAPEKQIVLTSAKTQQPNLFHEHLKPSECSLYSRVGDVDRTEVEWIVEVPNRRKLQGALLQADCGVIRPHKLVHSSSHRLNPHKQKGRTLSRPAFDP